MPAGAACALRLPVTAAAEPDPPAAAGKKDRGGPSSGEGARDDLCTYVAARKKEMCVPVRVPVCVCCKRSVCTYVRTYYVVECPELGLQCNVMMMMLLCRCGVY